MKKKQKIFWCLIALVACLGGIGVLIAKASPSGKSPLSFKVRRYETNANGIVAFVRMQNVSGNIIQYEVLQRGTMRLRCEYVFSDRRQKDPPSRVSSFLHPGEAVVGEILLPNNDPVSVGVMIRKLPPPTRFPGNGLKLFFLSLEVRFRSMFDYKPCYLPEPLLQQQT